MSLKATVKQEQAKRFYETMLTIREFENNVNELYSRSIIPGMVHTYVGEEAIATGVCAALRDTDMITSTHRGHGHLIAKGADTKKMMAEILGKKTGYCKGKGGSMHIVDYEKGILGANGIVGGGVPIATGAAYASKLKGDDKVTIAFFGDGASNQGSVHESINMASAWKLPVVYVLENNLYGITVSIKRVTNVANLSDRAGGYGIPGVVVDGNDVEAVYAAAQKAIEYARAGNGPTILECKTYRHKGHFTGDACTYRTREEEQEWMAKCPIKNYRQLLLDEKIMTEAEITELEEKIDQKIQAAVSFAMDSPFPDASEAYDDIFYVGKEGE